MASPQPRVVERLPQGRSYTQLKDFEKIAIVNNLIGEVENGRLHHGAFTRSAKKFSVSVSTVRRIWKKYQSECTGTQENSKRFYQRKGRTYSSKYDPATVQQLVKTIPLEQRENQRSLAFCLGIARTTLGRLLKNKDFFRVHMSRVRPVLNQRNKDKRVDFCLDQVGEDGLHYKNMYDVIHIDEKWFNMKRLKKRLYLTTDEPNPTNTTPNKNHIKKFMFLAAVARPRQCRNRMWDGKIGIWPFAKRVPAARSSRNRPRGTLEWKEVSVDKDTYYQMLLTNVLPAIRDRWPRGWNWEERPVFIQHDNAKPHLVDHADLEAKARDMGIRVVFYYQPPNSPDLNVLDLGFFHSIQCLYYRKNPRNVDHMLLYVREAFEEETADVLNRVFLTLFAVMNEVVRVDGDNKYKLPHLHKDKMIREHGRLPDQLHASDKIVRILAELATLRELERLQLQEEEDARFVEEDPLITAYI